MDSKYCQVCHGALDLDDVVNVCSRCLVRGALVADDGWIADSGDSVSSEEASPEDSVDILGGYRLLEKIGQGGMGVIYRARQPGTNRDVALKVIHRSLVNSVRTETRFLTEAEAAAALDHPYIVPIIEVGTSDETPFFTMKLVKGQNLSAILIGASATKSSDLRATDMERKQDAELRHRVELVSKVADAVHYAHEHGVIHRDLKPSNILVDEFGEPNIIDFGLAKRLDEDASLTMTGELIGTPSYMAPEQIGSGNTSLSIAVDIYALGGILHYCLTGRPAFTGASPLEVLNRVQSEELGPLSTQHPWIDRDLSTITLKCLEKEPESRYATAEDVGADLRRWLRGEPIQARSATPWERCLKWCRRRPYVASIVASCLLVIGLLLLQLGQTYRRAVDSEAEIQVANARLGRTLEMSRNRLIDEYLIHGDYGKALAFLAANLRDRGTRSGALPFAKYLIETQPYARRLSPELEHGDEVPGIVFHPDGLRVATSCFDGAGRIWWIETGQLAAPPMRHDEGVYRIDFSPDGERILTSAYDSSARVWDADTGEPISPPMYVAEVPLVAYFSPDGTRIITAGPGCAVKVWRGDGKGEPLMTLNHDKKHFAIHIAEIVPGRDQIITGAVDGSLWLWDLKSGSLVAELAPKAGYQSDVVVSPREDCFVQLAQLDPHLWRIDPSEQIQRLRHVGGMVWSAAFSGNGAVLSTLTDQRLSFWDAKTGHRLELVSGVANSASRMRRLDEADALVFYNHDTVLTSRSTHYEPLFGAITASSTIASVHPASSGRRIAILTSNHTASIWEWAQPDEAPVLYRSPVGKRDDLVAFGLDENNEVTLVLATYSDAGMREVSFLDPEVSETSIGWDVENVAMVSWPVQSLVAVLVDSSTGLLLVDTRTQRVREINGVQTVDSLALSPNGQWLIGEVYDGSGLWRYSTEESQRVGDPLKVDGEATVCRFSSDGQVLVAGRRLGGFKAWRVSDWSVLGEVQGRWGETRALAFSPDSQMIAAGSDDGFLRIYALEDGFTDLWEADLGSAVKSVVFSPDNRRIIAGTLEGEITVWDAGSAEWVTSEMAHSAEVLRLALHPNGRSMLAVYSDQKLRFWDVSNSNPLSPLLPWYGGTGKEGNRYGMGPIANLSPDGHYYTVGLRDGRVEVRPVPLPAPAEIIPDWLTAFIEAWGGVRLGENDRQEVVFWEERLELFEKIESMSESDPTVAWAQQLLRANAVRSID